jgi:hypothetical protein
MDKITVKLGIVDIPNKNGLMIPRDIMQQAIDSFEGKPIFGMFGKSFDGKIKLTNITHWIENARIEGDDIVGELYLLGDLSNPDTGIIEAMDELVCSPAGYGTTEDRGDGIMVVQSGYRLIAFNIVDPR